MSDLDSDATAELEATLVFVDQQIEAGADTSNLIAGLLEAGFSLSVAHEKEALFNELVEIIDAVRNSILRSQALLAVQETQGSA